ncbi:hypothetical protein ACJX0J_020299, partial [Zea mays]
RDNLSITAIMNFKEKKKCPHFYGFLLLEYQIVTNKPADFFKKMDTMVYFINSEMKDFRTNNQSN